MGELTCGKLRSLLIRILISRYGNVGWVTPNVWLPEEAAVNIITSHNIRGVDVVTNRRCLYPHDDHNERSTAAEQCKLLTQQELHLLQLAQSNQECGSPACNRGA